VLKQRVVTAVVMATVLISAVLLLDTIWVGLLIGVVVFIGAMEWARLAGLDRTVMQTVYALVVFTTGVILYLLAPGDDAVRLLASLAVIWWALVGVRLITHHGAQGFFTRSGVRLLAGLLTLVPAWYLLVFMHSRPQHGPLVMLYSMALVWIADIGAYFAGRRLGRHKLAAHISPGKTVEGLVGSLLATALWGLIGAWWLGFSPVQTLLLVGLVLVAALFSVAGDLLESILKRVAGVKDSGHLLPGHGGVLDRIDSVTAAIPVVALGLSLLGVLS
jgi:phosphatidate cytidylyltransferase